MNPSRIGIFGGSFDPPHCAHVALVQAAINQLRLDTLFVIPTGQAWHKSRSLTPAHHRLAMSQLAFAGESNVNLDDREILRSGPSYTIDTLLSIQAEYPNAQLFLIIGYDQALALKTWHRWQEIVDLAIICIACRPETLANKADISDSFAYIPAYRHLEFALMPVSSTQIRQEIALKHPVNALVSDAVLRYIDQHHLYHST